MTRKEDNPVLLDPDTVDYNNCDPFTGVENQNPVSPSSNNNKMELSTLEDSFAILDATTVRTQNTRDYILDKLIPVISNFKLDVSVETDPELYQAQARMIDQARQLLNDCDATARNHTNLKLKKTAIDDQREATVNVVEVLSQIKLNNAAWNVGDVNKPAFGTEEELASALQEATKDEVILDGELEFSPGKLPRPDETDANDPFSE